MILLIASKGISYFQVILKLNFANCILNSHMWEDNLTFLMQIGYKIGGGGDPSPRQGVYYFNNILSQSFCKIRSFCITRHEDTFHI